MSFNIYHAGDAADDLTATEALLVQKIEEYRAQNGLPSIPVSRSLSIVAARHDEDMLYNLGGYQIGIPGQNNAHGWSDAAYNALDSSTYSAVWTAPQRLGTAYTGNGYEILTGYLAPFSATVTITPDVALNSWKGSPAHNNVILNLDVWKNITWTAIGVGMQNGVASIWFGADADPAGSPNVDLQGTYRQYTVDVSATAVHVRDNVAGRDPEFTIPNASKLVFTDGSYDVLSRTFTPAGGPATLAFANATTGAAGSTALAAVGAGAPDYLMFQYIYAGSDNIAFSTSAPSVFIHAGSGNDAIQASSGSNVLDGGAGSNFLTGGSGTDTFFTDARAPGVVWNTLRNFHAGDAATLWGFVPGVSTYWWEPGITGAPGNEGATLRANIVGGAGRMGDGIDASITFAGMSVAQAKTLQIATGTQQAGSYLYLAA